MRIGEKRGSDGGEYIPFRKRRGGRLETTIKEFEKKVNRGKCRLFLPLALLWGS